MRTWVRVSRVQRIVFAGTLAVLVLAVFLSVRSPARGPVDPIPKAQAIEMADACTEAAQAKLQPLVTLATSDVQYERVDGTDWTVRTSVNHKTAWADNWYDVTCVIGWTSPKVTVRSVEATAR